MEYIITYLYKKKIPFSLHNIFSAQFFGTAVVIFYRQFIIIVEKYVVNDLATYSTPVVCFKTPVNPPTIYTFLFFFFYPSIFFYLLTA